jgi:ketosteroid isomerase-like protein
MPSPHENLIRQAYAAFNQRDVDTGVALMTVDVDWPDVSTGGFVHGREEVRRHWHEQFSQLDPTVEPGVVSTRTDGRVAAEVRQLVRSLDGTLLSSDRLVHVFTIQDGLIRRMDVEPPTGPAEPGT